MASAVATGFANGTLMMLVILFWTHVLPISLSLLEKLAFI